MKILFVPNYFYLNMPLFEKLISRLSQKGINSSVWKLRGNTDIPADEKFGSSYFENRGIDFTEVPIARTICRERDIFLGFKLLIAALKNRKTIRRLLLKTAPEAVIVGSDLGNLNIRLLVDACYSYSIPVVIMYNCDLTEPAKKSAFSRLYSLNNKFIFNSAFLSVLRASLFNGTTPGEYAPSSKMYVMSEDIREKLVSRGITKDRIVLADMYFFDEIPGAQPEDLRKTLGASDRHRVVVFFSECIQSIYGNEYAENLYHNMSELTETLPDDIFFVIKLHPLENKEMASFVKEVFDKPKTKVVTDFDAESLIRIADLSIAHFSKVLINASLMNRRFLSINLMKDEKRTFISRDEADILEINSYDDFCPKIKSALDDAEYKNEADKVIRGIAKRFSPRNVALKTDIFEDLVYKK